MTNWMWNKNTLPRVYFYFPSLESTKDGVSRAGCDLFCPPARQSSWLWNITRSLPESPRNYRTSHFKCHFTDLPRSGSSWRDQLQFSRMVNLFYKNSLVSSQLLTWCNFVYVDSAFHCRSCCCSLQCFSLLQDFPPSHYMHQVDEFTSGHPLPLTSKLPLW